jgi:hypothetical protein
MNAANGSFLWSRPSPTYLNNIDALSIADSITVGNSHDGRDGVYRAMHDGEVVVLTETGGPQSRC